MLVMPNTVGIDRIVVARGLTLMMLMGLLVVNRNAVFLVIMIGQVIAILVWRKFKRW